MTHTASPTAGQRVSYAHDSRLITTIRRATGASLDDRATKKPDRGSRALAHAAIA